MRSEYAHCDSRFLVGLHQQLVQSDRTPFFHQKARDRFMSSFKPEKTLRKTTINPKFKPNHCKNKRLIFSCSILKMMVVIGKQYTDSHGH